MGNNDTSTAISRGMAAEMQLLSERLAGGQKLIGWKVGFGSPDARQRFSLEAPLVGFLTDQALLFSGARLALGDFQKAIVEPEIAIHMGENVKPGADRDEAASAVAALGAALEVADLTFPPDDIEKILSGNIYQRHVIFGQPDASRAGCLRQGLRARVRRVGTEVADSTDLEANTGELVEIICQVANALGEVGETLEAGQIIIAGSVVPPMMVNRPELIEYELRPLDPISISFA